MLGAILDRGRKSIKTKTVVADPKLVLREIGKLDVPNMLVDKENYYSLTDLS